MHVNSLRIDKVGSSGPAIGVELRALSFEEGSVVAHSCRAFVDHYGIHDYHVEIRESRVMRQAGNRPWAEGTGGFYLSAGGDDKNVYLVTARHVVLPLDDNKVYEQSGNSDVREDVVVLGDSCFNEKLADVDHEIKGKELAVKDAKEWVEDPDDPERNEAEQSLRNAEKGLKALRALRHEIDTHWRAKEKRVFGELAWAPPIIDASKLDANNYRGNSINIGNKYSHQDFMDKVYLHYTSTSFKFPCNGLMTLEGQVPESALVKPPMLDANDDQCLVVFKNGAKTGTTIGKTNNVSSFTRTDFAGQKMESREWLAIPTDKRSCAFSDVGDSGSCVADALNRVSGIVIGGSGACDVTYVTPISLKTLHTTKTFQHAHLDPVLA